MRSFEDSLRRLGDFIDVYQVHRPHQDTDVEETLGALTDLVRQGKVRYIGSSSYAATQIVDAVLAAFDRKARLVLLTNYQHVIVDDCRNSLESARQVSWIKCPWL